MIKRTIIWYGMLTKRFLKKISFWLLLCLVPVLVLCFNTVSQNDSHMLRMAVYVMPSEDLTGERIMEDLQALDGVVHYECTESEEQLRRLVGESEVDGGYIIPSDMAKHIESYVSGHKSNLPFDGHLILFVSNEDTIQMQLAREQFFGIIFPYISKAATVEFTQNQDEFRQTDKNLIKDNIEKLYDDLKVDGSIFKFSYSTSGEAQILDNHIYLTAPLRGFLALFVLLCGMAAVLFWIRDKKAGKFQWLRYHERLKFLWIYILSSVIPGAAAAYLALFFSGNFTHWIWELVLMALLAVAVSGFSVIFAQLVKRMAVMAAAIPLILLLSAVLCPVFVSLRGMKVIKYLLPPYFYLSGLHSVRLASCMLIYVIAAAICTIIIDRVRFKIPQ